MKINRWVAKGIAMTSRCHGTVADIAGRESRNRASTESNKSQNIFYGEVGSGCIHQGNAPVSGKERSRE
jgi:hypothetical protein